MKPVAPVTTIERWESELAQPNAYPEARIPILPHGKTRARSYVTVPDCPQIRVAWMHDVIEYYQATDGQTGKHVSQVQAGASAGVITIHDDQVEELIGVLTQVSWEGQVTIPGDEIQAAAMAELGKLAPDEFLAGIRHASVVR